MGGKGKKAETIASIASVTALVAVYCIAGTPGYLLERNVVSALTYHFFHANPIHLAVNCYALFVLARRGLRIREMLTAYAMASASYFCISVPTVGISNILFALMGLRTPSIRSRWWKSPGTIVFLAVMFGYIFVPGVSAVTHIVSFFAGCAIACARRVTGNINSDYGKAKENRKRVR